MSERTAMGCVYEEPAGPAPARRYVLERAGRPMLDWTPSVCPLYLGRLPGLVELQVAAPQWRRGTLAPWLGVDPGDVPGELLEALAALEAGQESYAADPGRPRRGEA